MATAPHPSALLAVRSCVCPHNLPRSCLRPSDPLVANLPPSGPSSICPRAIISARPSSQTSPLLSSWAGVLSTNQAHPCVQKCSSSGNTHSLLSPVPGPHQPCEPQPLLQLLALRPHTNLWGPFAQENTCKWSLIRRQGRLSQARAEASPGFFCMFYRFCPLISSVFPHLLLPKPH